MQVNFKILSYDSSSVIGRNSTTRHSTPQRARLSTFPTNCPSKRLPGAAERLNLTIDNYLRVKHNELQNEIEQRGLKGNRLSKTPDLVGMLCNDDDKTRVQNHIEYDDNNDPTGTLRILQEESEFEQKLKTFTMRHQAWADYFEQQALERRAVIDEGKTDNMKKHYAKLAGMNFHKSELLLPSASSAFTSTPTIEEENTRQESELKEKSDHDLEQRNITANGKNVNRALSAVPSMLANPSPNQPDQINHPSEGIADTSGSKAVASLRVWNPIVFFIVPKAPSLFVVHTMLLWKPRAFTNR